ncbi:MAG: hypothetical protein HOP09_14235 [Hyphomicrobium sp.]|nr:hypothetical protein [Hyphomicrobium sp.]
MIPKKKKPFMVLPDVAVTGEDWADLSSLPAQAPLPPANSDADTLLASTTEDAADMDADAAVAVAGPKQAPAQ